MVCESSVVQSHNRGSYRFEGVAVLVDSLGAFEDMPDWAESADVLFEAGMTLNPSELHGAIVGLIAAGFEPAAENHLNDTIAALERALAIEMHGELVDFVARMNLATLSSVVDTDFGFQLLLPADDDSLEERLLSLGRWATGFLTGFTQGIAVRGAGESGVPAVTAEVVKDIAEVARIDSEALEEEDSERDFHELIEYLRIAALNVVQEALSHKEGE